MPMTTLKITSFGYGHAAPPAAHLTIDVRSWFRDPIPDGPERQRTGRDPEVAEKVLKTPGVQAFVAAQLAALVVLAGTDPARELTVAVGCVGGRHRSVAIAGFFADLAWTIGWAAEVEHRDIDRPVLKHV